MNIQGFDFGVDSKQAILWQYNQATTLLQLLQDKQNWLDLNQTEFWWNPETTTDYGWYQNVFNLLTANDFGLAVWSIILDVPLFLAGEIEPDDNNIFGFNYFTAPLTPFNSYLNFGVTTDAQSNFSNRGTEIILTSEQQRFLLRLRYFQLTTLTNIAVVPTPHSNTAPLNLLATYSINQFLNYLCSTSDIGFTGTIYALDALNMSMKYVITTNDFPQALLNAIRQEDLFPRPAGVLINYFINSDSEPFGFAELTQSFAQNQNFFNSNFFVINF